MLAHIRKTHDECSNTKTHQLGFVFDIMKSTDLTPTNKQVRLQERLAKRPCPFICFREEETDVVDVDEEEAVDT